MKQMMDDNCRVPGQSFTRSWFFDTHSVDKEPMFPNGLLVEEELSSRKSHVKEIGSESGNPCEDGETSTCLEHEEGDDLLRQQANNDGGPRNDGSVDGGKVETELEHKQADYRDATVSVSGALS